MGAAGIAMHPVATRAGSAAAEKLMPKDAPVAHTPPHLLAPLPQPSRVWGLQHKDLDAYPVVDTSSVEDAAVPMQLAMAPPIRALNATELRTLYEEYKTLDVPYNVVFPFLYCGHNGHAVQNHFFHASTESPSAPNYRGLTIVRASEPSDSDSDQETLCDYDQGNVPLSAPPTHSMLVSSLAPEEVLRFPPGAPHLDRPAPHDSRFRRQPSSSKVSMRNFQAQSINYAMISDIVVYSPEGPTETAKATALAFRYAQQNYWYDRVKMRLDGLQYNVFLVTEPFAELEQKCPELVALDSRGVAHNHVDFLQREQDEMYHMARASPIATNVYLGASRDFLPNATLPQDAPVSGAPTFSIGLEALEDSQPPPARFLHTVSDSFASFDKAVAHGERVQVPTAHFECPTGTMHRLTREGIHAVSHQVLTMCAWLDAHVDPAQCLYPNIARRALIHCPDGYTESSVFALSYLMYTKRISLSDAYLELQLEYGRSFFVFAKDLELLAAIEARIASLPVSVDRALRPSQSEDWMDDENFDGSFPSRILPFLYLGNLGHARNARLLHALGITHVVSVGESAIHDDSTDPASHSLAAAHHDGSIKLLNLTNVADDGTDPLREMMCEATEFIEDARKTNGRVLVHCRVGVSRSSTIVIAYAMAHLDCSLIDAYLLVRSRRLNVLIQPHLLFFWELRGWEACIAACQGRLHPSAPMNAAPCMELGGGRGCYALEDRAYQRAGAQSVTWSYFCREIAALNARYRVG